MAASRGGQNHFFGNDAEQAILPAAGFPPAVTASLNLLSRDSLADGRLVSECPVIRSKGGPRQTTCTVARASRSLTSFRQTVACDTACSPTTKLCVVRACSR